MKQIYLLIAAIVFDLSSFCQTVYNDRRDGEIYFKFKNDYKLNLTNDEAGNVPLEQLSFLNELFGKYDVTQVQRSFYFAKEIELLQTIRIYFSKIDLVDAFIRDLQQLPFAEYAEHVPLLKFGYDPNDLGANSFNNGRWHLWRINARQAWDISRGNPNIKVAIVDDAVQTDHPDLAANMLAGRDVALGNNNPNPPTTTYSHGTHVAGCASAVTDNGVGIASIGFSVKIIPVKATNNANSISHGYEGVTWASNNGANVINMSWGSTFGGNTGANVVNAAFNSGKTLVAAAGNDNNSTTFFPAAYTNVIAVAATTSNDAKSSFSNYGSWITVSAPGTNLRSTVPTNSYATQSGTSMASPVVAGLCGLVLSVNPTFTPTQVRNCITSTADNINSANANFVGQLGSGRINAYQALICAQGSTVQFDAGISKINTPQGSSCSNSFAPQVVLKNFGTSTLTSATIQYRIDNGTINTFNWTGSLASQAEAIVNLPSQTTTNGAHTFTANTTNTLNGNQTDANANNNSLTSNFTIFAAPGLPLPFTETFESNSFATNNWTIENPDNGLTWELFTTAGTTPGNRSLRLPFYSYQTTGQRDGLITPPLDFTGFDTIKLRFEHAYRRYNQNSTDSLIIYVSTNCGSTWTRIFARGENGSGTFATTKTSTVDFVPSQASDWCIAGTVGTQCFDLNLNSFKDNNAVRIKFEGFNNYQNNLYLDNINVIGVKAGSPPVAQFTATPTSVCSGSTVSFSNQSTNQPTSYNWSFPGGNPSSSTLANPSVRYDNPGTYDVSLTATNGNGSNSITKTSYITVQPKPSVSGSYSPPQVCDGDEVTLTGNGAVDYTWKSGLSTLNGSSIEVTIFGSTVYQLIGVDGNGCSDTVNVNVISSPKPVASVTSDFALCSGSTASLNASGGTSYQWNNGETGNFIFVSPTQTTTYEVYVSLPGSACVDTASVTVTVLPQKSTQISETVCGNNYFFNGQLISQSGIYSSTLTASNSCDSVVTLNLTLLQNPTTNLSAQICSGNAYSFNGQSLTQPGVYSAIYQSADGCDSTVWLSLSVNPIPSPTVSQNGNVLSTQNYTAYQWLLNGSNLPGENNQTISVTQNGVYTVVVIDSFGCEGTSAAFNFNGVNIMEVGAGSFVAKLFPNPATNQIQVELTGKTESGISEIKLTDFTGKFLSAQRFEGNSFSLDVSLLASAVYFIEVSNGKTVYRTRFTKL